MGWKGTAMAKVSARPLVLGLSQLRYDTSQQLDPRRWRGETPRAPFFAASLRYSRGVLENPPFFWWFYRWFSQLETSSIQKGISQLARWLRGRGGFGVWFATIFGCVSAYLIHDVAGFLSLQLLMDKARHSRWCDKPWIPQMHTVKHSMISVSLQANKMSHIDWLAIWVIPITLEDNWVLFLVLITIITVPL